MKWQCSDPVPSRITPLMQGSSDRSLPLQDDAERQRCGTKARPSPKPRPQSRRRCLPSNMTTPYASSAPHLDSPSAGLYGKTASRPTIQQASLGLPDGLLSGHVKCFQSSQTLIIFYASNTLILSATILILSPSVSMTMHRP